MKMMMMTQAAAVNRKDKGRRHKEQRMLLSTQANREGEEEETGEASLRNQRSVSRFGVPLLESYRPTRNGIRRQPMTCLTAPMSTRHAKENLRLYMRADKQYGATTLSPVCRRASKLKAYLPSGNLGTFHFCGVCMEPSFPSRPGRVPTIDCARSFPACRKDRVVALTRIKAWGSHNKTD